MEPKTGRKRVRRKGESHAKRRGGTRGGGETEGDSWRDGRRRNECESVTVVFRQCKKQCRVKKDQIPASFNIQSWLALICDAAFDPLLFALRGWTSWRGNLKDSLVCAFICSTQLSSHFSVCICESLTRHILWWCNILLGFLQWIRLVSSKSYRTLLCFFCCHQMKLSFYFTLQWQHMLDEISKLITTNHFWVWVWAPYHRWWKEYSVIEEYSNIVIHIKTCKMEKRQKTSGIDL